LRRISVGFKRALRRRLQIGQDSCRNLLLFRIARHELDRRKISLQFTGSLNIARKIRDADRGAAGRNTLSTRRRALVNAGAGCYFPRGLVKS
jgi:hypothetical protein